MTLCEEEIQALVGGRHRDSFARLGMHEAPGGGLVVRALLPWADAVSVLERATGKAVAIMLCVHEDGLFEVLLPGLTQPFAYQLRASQGGRTLDLEDPYRFPSQVGDADYADFMAGREVHAWHLLGAHPRRVEEVDGVLFTVWAPNAWRVSVVGDFNGWDGRQHSMRRHPATGVWEIFLPAVPDLAHYKYEVIDAQGRLLPLKADPCAMSMQHPPQTASRVLHNSGSWSWSDQEWLQRRRHPIGEPVSIYEVHLGSWRRRVGEDQRFLSYLELADELIPYVLEQGFTHIQLMPLSEYPFDGSWGYQPVGLYAPTIRFGTPDEFRCFVDRCHAAGLGVLLDWVPGHFPTDPHGLARFDGTALYEHEDPRQGFHPDWNTLIYNYGRAEVRSFLISNANYWLEEFHLDGLRVDAVASMLYLDYSRRPGEWLPNAHGGRENLEAIDFLKTLNCVLHARHPGVLMIAEESTAWPGVSRPVDAGGLGFGFKWNMGWMNDTLQYMGRDPIHRRYHHDEMTFGLVYAWDEHFVLPLSHDEVVHGKGSLIGRMPGDQWQKFANLRAYLAFMWGHPGRKLLFMGGEIAQWREWSHQGALDWHLLDDPRHRGVQQLVRDLNDRYRHMPALHARDDEAAGFRWLQVGQRDLSVLAWLRLAHPGDAPVLVACNFTPGVQQAYRIGVPVPGRYWESLNTDAPEYGGSGQQNSRPLQAEDVPWDGQPWSIVVTLPPLATLYLAGESAA